MTADDPGLPVIAAYDGSHVSVRAAQLAAGAARRRGARLHLPHTWLDVPDRLRARADTDLVTVSRSLASAGMEVSSSVREGDPVEALRAASAEAQLLVMGHRDATAQAVAESARCPVLVIPDNQTSIVVRGRRSVVVGVEGATDAGDVLPFAFPEAASRQTDLLAVHAWRETPARPSRTPRVPSLTGAPSGIARDVSCGRPSAAGGRGGPTSSSARSSSASGLCPCCSPRR